tara:strand:+ start:1767 stop:2453 length:687 start_codon:yes stop_codon:yes gene_type:complete
MNTNIIINGINEESLNLLSILTDFGINDVIFIDSDKYKVKNLNSYSDNNIAIFGNPVSPEFLESCGVNRDETDTIFVSVTRDDSINLISCQIAKYKYKAFEVISLVNQSENRSLFSSVGIDNIIYPDSTLVDKIINSSGGSIPLNLMDIPSKGTAVWSVEIPSSSVLIGTDINNLNIPFRALVLGKIDNKGNPYDSSEKLDIEAGDSLLIISSIRNKDTMVRFFQGSD